MRIYLLFITLLIGACSNTFSQVTGKAYLDGSTDYTGIKVKFVAQSPTAQTDSTFTLADGSYSINLKGGIYIVSFQKNDIEDSYQKGAAILIQTKQTLDDVTISNTVYVSGVQKGNWTKKKKYKVIGDINIQANDSLIIEAGTKIEFQGPYGINLGGNAVFNASGTPSDKIIFTSSKKPLDSLWNGIRSVNGIGIFENCIFENFNKGLYFDGGGVLSDKRFDVLNCEFRNFLGTAAIMSYMINSKIENNLIHDFVRGEGISALGFKNPLRCNHIYNGSSGSFGLWLDGYFDVSDNYLHDIDSTAIICSYEIPDLKNNVIIRVGVGIDISIYMDSNEAGPILNNFLSNCKSFGIRYSSNGIIKKEDIANNVFYQNKCAIKMADYNTASVTTNSVVNNLFYQNETNFQQLAITSIGAVVATNANGDPIDSYNNLYQDPLFINALTPVFLANSPTYKAGLNGVNIGFDIKGTCVQGYLLTPRRSSDTLSISGKVHEGNGLATNATVVAINKETKATYSVAINVDGSFIVDSLPAGTYLIKAIPTGVVSSGYSITYYPKTTDENKAVSLTLVEKITDVDIYLAQLVGVDDALIAGMSVSPNPFSERLELQTSAPISIMDATGRVIYEGIPDAILDTHLWKSGLYLLNSSGKVQKLLKY